MAGPDTVVPFTCYGLRKTSAGYELVKVVIGGNEPVIVHMRQAEPQRAIAFRYLEAAVEDAYMETRNS